MNKRIYVALATFILVAVIVFISGSHITGRAAVVGSDIEIQEVSLSVLELTNPTLAVDVAAAYRSDIASDQTFELFINGELVDTKNASFSKFNETKTIALEWVISAGTHAIKVKVDRTEAEKLIKITETGGEFTVNEITTGSPALQTHILDFKTGLEYDLVVQPGDLMQATFEAQTYLFEVESIAETTASLRFRDKVIELTVEPQLLDLNSDGRDDITITLNKIASGRASLTFKSTSSVTVLDVMANFWWLIIILAVIAIAIFLMYKYEKQRVKQKKHLLNRVEDYRKSGVLSDSLYKKATDALKKKLKP